MFTSAPTWMLQREHELWISGAGFAGILWKLSCLHAYKATVKQEKSCIHVLWPFSYILTFSSQIGSQKMIIGLTLCSQTSLGIMGDTGEL